MAATTPVPASEPGLAGIVEKAQRSFDEMKAMTASFSQTVESKGFGEVERLSGRMAMMKPAMMRWDYDNPPGRKLVVDGKRLWFYDPEENVVYFDDLTGFLNPKSPALFLAGEGALEELFVVEPVKKKNDTADLIRLKLTPKKPQPGLKAMLLSLEKEDYTIVELLMVDHLGNRNRIQFSEIDKSPKLDRSFFRFEPPTGAPVRAMPKAPPGR